jgi:hypothetical protein
MQCHGVQSLFGMSYFTRVGFPSALRVMMSSCGFYVNPRFPAFTLSCGTSFTTDRGTSLIISSTKLAGLSVAFQVFHRFVI